MVVQTWAGMEDYMCSNSVPTHDVLGPGCVRLACPKPRKCRRRLFENIAAMARAGLACPVTPKAEDLVKKILVAAMARAGLACPDTPKTKDLVKEALAGGSMGAAEVLIFGPGCVCSEKKAPAGGSTGTTEVVFF